MNFVNKSMYHYYASIVVLLFFLLFLLSPTNSKAQSLNEIINQAITNNLDLKILDLEYKAALEKAPQVNELPDPEIGIGAFPLPVETRLGAQVVRIGATQMFPWPGLLDGQKELELAKAKAVYQKIGARTLDLSFQIKQSYYQLYELEQSHTIIQRNLQILQSLEQLALARVENGQATAADVLRVQLKKEELEKELEILQLARTKPTAQINQLLNRPLQTPVILNDSLSFAAIPYNRDTLTANIEENHPMIRMFALQQDISRQAINLNELNGKPSFGIGFDYIMVNQRTDANPSSNGRDIVQLRASVKVPLYRKKYEAKEREENLKIAALSDQKVNVQTQFLAAIEQAFADYEMAKLRIDLYDRQSTITQAAINILETQYSTQGSNFDELLRLEKDLIDYDLKKLKAIVNSHLAKASIERYLMF